MLISASIFYHVFRGRKGPWLGKTLVRQDPGVPGVPGGVPGVPGRVPGVLGGVPGVPGGVPWGPRGSPWSPWGGPMGSMGFPLGPQGSPMGSLGFPLGSPGESHGVPGVPPGSPWGELYEKSLKKYFQNQFFTKNVIFNDFHLFFCFVVAQFFGFRGHAQPWNFGFFFKKNIF